MNLKLIFRQLKPILFTLILLLGVIQPAGAAPAPVSAAPIVAFPPAHLSAPALNPATAPSFGLIPSTAALDATSTITLPAWSYSWTKTWGGANGKVDAGGLAIDVPINRENRSATVQPQRQAFGRRHN